MGIPVNRLPHDDIHPFLHALGKAGCDDRMVEQIKSEEKDALFVVASFLLRKRRYITPPAEQIAFIREMKRLMGWPISEDSLRAATKMAIVYDPCDLRRVPVLVPTFFRRGEGQGDADQDKHACMRQHFFHALIHSRLLWPWFDQIGVQVNDEEFNDYFVKTQFGYWDYSLAWYFMDLTARKGVDLHDVTEHERHGLLALAAAAMHPIWVLGMNGEDIPYVWVYGTPLGLGRAAREQACIYCEHMGPVMRVWFRRRDARKPYPDFCVPKVVDCRPVAE